MHIYRVIGAAIVALSGIVGAYLLNVSARASLTQTEGFITLVRFLRSEIECFSLPVPAVLQRCPEETLKRCGYQRVVRPKSIGTLTNDCNIADAELGTLLRRFSSEIGRGYKKEQLALCDACISSLEAIRRRLSEQLPMRQRLNGALCVCGALAVVILLL